MELALPVQHAHQKSIATPKLVQVKVDVIAEGAFGAHQVSMVNHGALFLMALLYQLKLHLKVAHLRFQNKKESTVGQVVALPKLDALMLVVTGVRAV